MTLDRIYYSLFLYRDAMNKSFSLISMSHRSALSFSLSRYWRFIHRTRKRKFKLGFDSIFGVQSASDQQSTHFTRSRSDLVQFRVAQKTAGRIIIDVTISPEDLNAIEAELSGLFSTVQDHPSTILNRNKGSRIDQGSDALPCC